MPRRRKAVEGLRGESPGFFVARTQQDVAATKEKYVSEPNPPAFPRNVLDHGHGVTTVHESGMTLLDYMAAKAMQGAITGMATRGNTFVYAECAGLAYEMADAMLKERAKWIK